MPFFLAKASGLLGGSFAWSFGSTLFSSSGEATVAAQWDTAILAFFQTASLLPYIAPATTLTGTSVSTASPQFKQTTITKTAHATAGTSTSPSMGYHTAPVVSFYSPNATKWGRARWFLFPLATNALAVGGYVLLPAAQTALQTAVNNFGSARGSAFTLQILHRRGSIDGTRGALSTDQITTASIADNLNQQRRRADKRTPIRMTATP